MKNLLNFNKKNVFFYTIIFLFINIVFLNFIQNSTNYYKKIDYNHQNKETFVLIEKTEIKKEISNTLVSHKTYENSLDRDCKITGNFHDRHKVRWLKSLFLIKIFNFSAKLSELMPYYLNIIMHSSIIFLIFLLLNKTFQLNKIYSLLFLTYITFIFQHSLSEYSYSIFETFFLSLALFASKEKRQNLFLISCLFAIFNRESGFIIIFTWLIFNNEKKDLKKIIFFSLICSLVFILANFKIIKCLLNPKFFVPLDYQEGQVNFLDLYNANFLSIIKLIFENFLLPFGLGFYYLYLTKNKNKVLVFLFLIYLLIFILATPAHHISVRLMIIPLIFSAIYFYQNQNHKSLK